MLLRYFHTLRHLYPSQVAWRIYRRLIQPKPDLCVAPPLRGTNSSWQMHRWRTPVMLKPERFRFLNKERHLHFPDAWNDVGVNRLWLYNLHYFDDLNATAADDRQAWHRALIRRWVAENPPARGTGWEPYPLSLRIVNWIKWTLSGGELEAEAIHSLAVQVRLLRRQLEFHLRGNHLLENAKALVFAGLFFEGEEAQEWFHTGTRLLNEQIEEQILVDGGHFELSPMYHALILEGLLDIVNLYLTFGINFPTSWYATSARMFDWLRMMSHPDGGIAFFNDAAFGIAPCIDELERYAENLRLEYGTSGIGSHLLAASGYARLECNGAVVIADVAAIGADYQPGHAHADSLSFEFSLGKQRILVNSGTSVYDTSDERLRQRGTAAHNTVRLDGENSSEIWSSFRVARRARVRIDRFDSGDVPILEASHSGYSHLAGRPMHKRQWKLGTGVLRLNDRIEGSGEHQVEVIFHFHPDIRPEFAGDGKCTLTCTDAYRMLKIHVSPVMAWKIEIDSWHPEFGLSVASRCLRGVWRGSLPVQIKTKISWHH